MPLETVRALAAAGWEIASHSLFHRRMEKLPPTCADEGCKDGRRAGYGIFTAACPWADVGTVVEDSAYLPRCPTFAALGAAESGFFHDVENGLIYVRPRAKSDLESRLKLGSMERELQRLSHRSQRFGFRCGILHCAIQSLEAGMGSDRSALLPLYPLGKAWGKFARSPPLFDAHSHTRPHFGGFADRGDRGAHRPRWVAHLLSASCLPRGSDPVGLAALRVRTIGAVDRE